jgi:glutaredoxin
MVKKYLNMKGQTYQEINIEEQPEKQQEMMEMTGARTVPVTIVTNDDTSKHITIGFNAARLASAIA